MEDFYGAFVQRALDVHALHLGSNRTGAMHFGGIVLECRLKAIIVATTGISAWKTEGSDPGHTITNPGHELAAAARRIPKLWHRMQQFPVVLKWLQAVQTPGSHYIDLRYSCSSPDDAVYAGWHDAYLRLLAWLQRESTRL